MLGLALSALRQHRLRTVLTTLGVVFGTLVLTASLSIGLGIQQAMRAIVSNELLRSINIWPDWDGELAGSAGTAAAEVPGEMSETRRERLCRALARRNTQLERKPRPLLTPENLAAIRGLRHVHSVTPFAYQDGYVVLNGRSESANVGAARPGDAAFGQRIVAGRAFEKLDEPSIVVSEALLYVLGVTDEPAVDGVLGKKLRLETRVRRRAGLGIYITHPEGGVTSRIEAAILARITKQLPQLVEKLDLSKPEKDILRGLVTTQPGETGELFTREFTIVGVMRAHSQNEQKGWAPFRVDGDVALPVKTATDFYFDAPGPGDKSMHRAVVLVDREENVEGVLADIRKLGFQSWTPLENLKQNRLMYLLIFSGMTCVAVVSLIVAGLGIANTMLISVLQRTREIGIMKAVGADSRHLQIIFLVEGAIIGCVGGALGLLVAWGASFPADAWIQSMAARDLNIELTESICAFPLWLPPAVFAFAVAVTLLAALYPSRRAACVDPVAALRYE